MRPKTLFLLLSLALAGCSPAPTSPRGFRLPDGDAEAGRAAFVQHDCLRCHSVEGAELGTGETTRIIDVRLGGKVIRVGTYGELVTAIINPSHDLSREYRKKVGSADMPSPMIDHNATMTVQELVDLVAFLQGTYSEYLPEDYDPYFP